MNRRERRARGHRGALGPRPAVLPAPEAEPELDVGMVAGWCSGLEKVTETKDRLRVKLLELMGDRELVGEVRFLVEPRAYAGETLEAARGGGVDLTDVEDRLARFGGFLVLAIAEGRRA